VHAARLHVRVERRPLDGQSLHPELGQLAELASRQPAGNGSRHLGVVREQRELDPLIDEALSKSWPLKRIDTVLRAALRAGAYELTHRQDVPARVVVAEYADVAAAFVERDETGMVNAVLDHLARRLRATEFGRATG